METEHEAQEYRCDQCDFLGNSKENLVKNLAAKHAGHPLLLTMTISEGRAECESRLECQSRAKYQSRSEYQNRAGVECQSRAKCQSRL